MAGPQKQWKSNGTLAAAAQGSLFEQPRGQHELSNGSNGYHQHHNSSLKDPFRTPNAQNRLLTVDAALQFSPLSSIVPFSPAILPIPNAEIPAPTSLFQSPSERRDARQTLELLNDELAKGNGRSSAAPSAERELKELLDGESITELKFKKIPRVQHDRKNPTTTSNGNAKSTKINALSPFANKILHETNLAYRYPTPISPTETTPSKVQLKSQKSPTRSSPKGGNINRVKTEAAAPQQPSAPHHTKGNSNTVQVPHSSSLPSYVDPSVLQKAPLIPPASRLVNNQESHSLNGSLATSTNNPTNYQVARSVEIEIGNVKPSTPNQPLPSSVSIHQPQILHATTQPTVIIPPPPSEFHPSDFVNYGAPTTPGDSRKRKRDVDAPSVPLTRDQRAEADEAVRRLHEVIGDILEADDDLQPDPSGVQSAAYNEFFISVFHEDSAVNALAPSMQARLESSLQKVISFDRLEDVPLDHLQRLLNLCMTAIIPVESADVFLHGDYSSDEVEYWTQQLEVLGNGLRSVRTVLRILTGGRKKKQLFSEELLQSVSRTVRKAIDGIIPVIEARSSAPQTTIFDSASQSKKILLQLLHDTNRVMAYLVKLISKEEMTESVITPLEYCAISLLFVENATNEKDSVLGIQKFESLRRAAMDMITIIYSRCLSQRTFLFTEIITSLQKLPTGRQAKRHYKLPSGKSIQIVSALIMQLVQTIAMYSPSSKKKNRPALDTNDEGALDQGTSNEISDQASVSNRSSESDDSVRETDEDDEATSRKMLVVQRLGKVADGLCNSAARSASYAARYLVNRAQTSSKTGDQPHRQLLDIFVEDLLTVLSAPEWPAAELLLRALFKSFADIIDDPKSLTPAKNMALELLGMIGSSISELISSVQHAAKSLDHQNSAVNGLLSQMADDYFDGSLQTSEILAWNGPFHVVVEFLQSKSTADDFQGASAHSYCLAQWAKAVSSSRMEGSENSLLAQRLLKGLLQKASLPFDSQDDISITQVSVAYALVVLNMDLCGQFDYILKVLLRSINTEATTVRSRALRSVTQMLERDPSLLDRSQDFKHIIGQCTTDGSSMVRDNALTLISKCVSLRPALETDFMPNVFALANDPAVGVRKRTIKLLKDLYTRNLDIDVKARVGDCLLHRAQDLDAGVSEIARQTLEDIWMTPLWNMPDMAVAGAQDKIALREQVDLIIRTIQRNDNARNVLEQLLVQELTDGSKFANSNFKVCKSLVATAFEKFLDALDSRREQHETLVLLTVFAKAKPSLFTSDQIQLLQPYIGNLSSTEDLDFFRCIVIIFRHALPELSDSHQDLRRNIQTGLLGSIQKLYKTELNEVAQCLWKLNDSLQNPEKLVNLTKAVLHKLHLAKNEQFAAPAQQDGVKRLRRYLWIAAAFGKHCDFEAYKNLFHNGLPWWSSEGDPSVADLIVQSMKPFIGQSQPLSLRVEALQSIGNVCQSWPRQYTKRHISNAFENILQKGEPELQHVVLSSFRDFLNKIESQAAAKSENTPPGADAKKGTHLGPTATASEDDGASTLIAQFFIKDLIKVALASQGDSALTAAEVITSINRQGLAHPKTSISAIVALETSTNAPIADVALQGHKILHQQHESALEQLYMRSVREAFRYQKETVSDPLGYNAQPISAKLKGLWEVIRTSSGKYQKKFLSNLTGTISSELDKLDLSGSPPMTLQYTRFLTENIAFFEYTRLDELLHTISCLEKAFMDVGSSVSDSICTEIFPVMIETEGETSKERQMEGSDMSQCPDDVLQGSALNEPPPTSQQKAVDPARLFSLTTLSIILTALWEARTYLRRLYGQSSQQQRRDAAKVRASAKDLSKAPTRVQGVSGDRLVTSIAQMVASLNSEEGMYEQCQKFVDLIKVDDEVKVKAESEEESLDRPQTPDGENDEDRDTPMSGSSRGHKRKSSASLAGTPAKRKRARPSFGRSKSSRRSIDGDDDGDGDWM